VVIIWDPRVRFRGCERTRPCRRFPRTQALREGLEATFLPAPEVQHPLYSTGFEDRHHRTDALDIERIDIEQQSRRAAVGRDLRVQHVRSAERQFERLASRRSLMQQVAEVGRRRLRIVIVQSILRGLYGSPTSRRGFWRPRARMARNAFACRVLRDRRAQHCSASKLRQIDEELLLSVR